MSNEINAAGKDLVVESITEIGAASSSRRVSEIKRLVDAKLIKRDYDKLKTQVGELTSDGVVSPSEKQQLYREWKNIVSSNSVFASQAEAWSLEEQLVYSRYANAFSALNAQLSTLLEDLTVPSDISGIDLLELFDEYYDASSLLEEELFHYQTGLLNGLDDRTKCELHLSCSSGLALPDDGSPATLSVVLLQEGVDSTAEMSDSDFTWERNEDGWEPRTGKSITIDVTDLVDGKANFLCRFKHFYSESMYWYAVNFITVQRYASPISVQINSTNGDKFRPGTVATTLIATVFKGDEDITDSVPSDAFRWYRKSSDSTGDESWNTSSIGLAKKQIVLTPEDISGRAVFFCEVDISQI